MWISGLSSNYNIVRLEPVECDPSHIRELSWSKGETRWFAVGTVGTSGWISDLGRRLPRDGCTGPFWNGRMEKPVPGFGKAELGIGSLKPAPEQCSGNGIPPTPLWVSRHLCLLVFPPLSPVKIITNAGPGGSGLWFQQGQKGHMFKACLDYKESSMIVWAT